MHRIVSISDVRLASGRIVLVAMAAVRFNTRKIGSPRASLVRAAGVVAYMVVERYAMTDREANRFSAGAAVVPASARCGRGRGAHR